MTMIPAMFTLFFISILLLSEGQAGESWEPSNKAMLTRLSGMLGHKSTATLCFTSFFKELICMLLLLQGVHRIHSVTLTKKAIVPGADHVCILLQNKPQQHNYTPETSSNSLSISTLWTLNKQTRYSSSVLFSLFGVEL